MPIKFYQTIPELGIEGRMNTPEEFDKIGLPKDMNGLSVLDIGCNIGAFLIESAKRGATVVVGQEKDKIWREYAREHLGKAKIKNWHVENVNKKLEYSKYDVVLLLSVLHLVAKPQKVLDDAWGKTRGLLIVEINDRLQKIPTQLPKEAKLYGKNKDNRSVWHCKK